MRRILVLLSAAVLVGGLSPALARADAARVRPQADWPTFLHDVERSSAGAVSTISRANAPYLAGLWSYKTGGPVVTSPTVVNHVVYVGSWDGYEYALNAATGKPIWRTFLGITTDKACFPPVAGVTSAATVSGGTVYVGGGGPYWYALDAATGRVLWKVFTGPGGQTGAHYNWSSPLVVKGYAYIGIASNCDNPLVQGQLLRVSLATHRVVGTFDLVPNGQVGGGVWTSPTYDSATNTIFVSTGTLNDYTQKLSQAVVALDATTLKLKSSWQLPFEAAVSDSDWGTTPTLTTDSAGRKLVGLANKNGILYTFDRNRLAAGPLWQKQIALGGDCPICGDGSISSGTFAGGVLYYGGGSNVGSTGAGHRGSVSAFDPGDGKVLWRHFTDQAVVPALAYDNGMLVVLQGNHMEVLDAATGSSIYARNLSGQTWGAPSVAEGAIFFGTVDGVVQALAPVARPKVPPDLNCPAGFSCQDIGPVLPGSERASGRTFTITGSGAQTNHLTLVDGLRLVSTPLHGDGQMSVDLVSQSMQGPPTAQPEAGLTMRQSNLANSPYYAITEYPNDNIEHNPSPRFDVWYRTLWGAGPIELTKILPAPLPLHLMVQRQGDALSTSMSVDGVHWKLVPGTTVSVVMPTTVMAGMLVSSGSDANRGTATFAGFSLGPVTTHPTPQPPAHPCPASWSCQDVGNPAGTGDQTLVSGTWTLRGAGKGIGGDAPPVSYSDAFHYVYRDLPGDGTVTARVTNPAANPAGSSAGIMMRADLTPGSPYYAMLLRPGGGAVVQWRSHDDLPDRMSVQLTGQASPAWFRIQRYTDTTGPVRTYYEAFTSADGATWSPVVGGTEVLDLGTSPLAGMVAADPVSYRAPASATVRAVSVLAGSGPRPPGVCPPPWMCTDVGAGIAIPGSQEYTPPSSRLPSGAFTFYAGGSDIWSVYDHFHFVYQPLVADGTLSADVASISHAGAGAKAGVMIRSAARGNADPRAPYFGVFATPARGVVVQYRTTEGGQTAQVAVPGKIPVYLMVARYTDGAHRQEYYTAYESTDGKAWRQIPGGSLPLSLPGPTVSGLAADSYRGANATVVFDDPALLKSAPRPAGVCPAAWQCEDIGGAQPAGSQVLDKTGHWTVTAGGGDIWSSADSFRYVWQTMPRDGTVSAAVTGQTDTSTYAKAGVMLRATAAPGSAYYAAFITPGLGVAVQWREVSGRTSFQLTTSGIVPLYLRVARYTDARARATYYTAYTSGDGKTWTAVAGSTEALSMPGTVLAGLAMTSHHQGILGTVDFASVSIKPGEVPPPTLCPKGWNCADVGKATPTGGQIEHASGAWTIEGGGGDIWGTTDSFHFVWKNVSPGGSATAQVVSQSPTNPFAKAGVMLRAGADAGSAYYAVFVTPGNGVAVQWRAARGASTHQVLVVGATPVYLRVTAKGTAFAAYISGDGITWVPIAGSGVTLPALGGQLLAGMAVTSHLTTAVSTVDFASVNLR